jgi:hypothetical protein
MLSYVPGREKVRIMEVEANGIRSDLVAIRVKSSEGVLQIVVHVAEAGDSLRS